MGKAHGQTGPKGITEDDIALALEATLGNEYYTAKALKCSTQNLRTRIAGSTRLIELRRHLKYDLREIAVGVVIDALKKKDLRAATFVIDRIGKDDGWARTIEHTGKGGAPIQHAVTTENFEPSTPEELANARSRFIDDGDDEGT